MGYFDDLEYKDMSKDPSKYFENKKVVNFDIIYHECRGDPLQGTYKGYQTVKSNDLQNCKRFEKKEEAGGLIRNIKRKDLFVEKNIVKENFKTSF